MSDDQAHANERRLDQILDRLNVLSRPQAPPMTPKDMHDLLSILHGLQARAESIDERLGTIEEALSRILRHVEARIASDTVLRARGG